MNGIPPDSSPSSGFVEPFGEPSRGGRSMPGRTPIRPIHRMAAGRLSAALVSAALVVALGLPAGPAHAAFPGVNAQIAFTSDRDGNQEIYGMAFDGSAQTNLTNNPGPTTSPRSRRTGRGSRSSRSGTAI